MNPVEYFLSKNWRVTSRYGPRTHPVTGVLESFHYGTDFGIPLGGPLNAPVPTPFAGVVTAIGEYGTRGKVVVVKIDGADVVQLFQHLHDYRCKKGDRLAQGDTVGLCGTTGRSTGIHLHYELRYATGSPWGDVWGDPAKYELMVRPPAPPSFAFAAKTWIKVSSTLRLNVRQEPGTASAIVAQLEPGDTRQIADHPDGGIWADGHHWWRIAEGWVAEDWLERTEEPAEPEPEEPEAEPEPLPPEPEPEEPKPLPPEPEPTPEPEPEPPPEPPPPHQEPEEPEPEEPEPPAAEGFFAAILQFLADLLQRILDGLRLGGGDK